MPRIKRSPSGLLMKRQTGVAVPVLAHPFPAPKPIQATVEKTSPKVGIHFRWKGGIGESVRIIRISEDSVLAEQTALAAGQTVLEINGIPVTSSIQAASLVRATEKSLTIMACPEVPSTPYCKLVTAVSISKENPPGINFSSTRGRCLVQISRVFRSGFFAKSNLKEGDIVLALNGIPLSKPEEAEQILRQQNQPYHVVYAVDGSEYRQSIVQELQANALFKNVLLEEKGDFVLRVRDQTFELSLDSETHHLVDHHSYLHLSSKEAKVYRNHVIPFLKAFNQGVEKRMVLLEEAVCHEVWKHSVATSPTAPKKLESLSSLHLQAQDEHNLVDNATAPSIEETHFGIPLAAAELEVLPLAALQTQLERSAHLAISTSS